MAFNLEHLLDNDAVVPAGAGATFAAIYTVRYPRPAEFFQVAGDRYSMIAGIIKEDRDRYLVDEAVVRVVPDDVLPTRLTLATNPEGELFIIPGPHVVPGARLSSWDRQWLNAIDQARNTWVRQPRRGFDLGRVIRASKDYGQPTWPDEPFDTIIAEAFGEFVIEDANHWLIRHRRGGE